MRLFLAGVAALSVAACATAPSERIAETLTGYGIERARAECVGDRLQKNLSIRQLLELGRIARSYRENDPNPDRLTLNDLIRVSSQVRDPKVPLEVAKAAGNCGLVSSPYTSMLGAFTGAR
jgi:hypothetical protein